MSNREEHKYDDIINLPHHVSTKHPHMPLLDRAAQFSPFAALTGHDAAISETARLTDVQIELDENRKEEINLCLQRIKSELPHGQEVCITYFAPDECKAGGEYKTVRGPVKKLDEYEGRLILADATSIEIDMIFKIER